MLQMKKQLREKAVGFGAAFPLLYSKFLSEEKFMGRPNADAPTAGHGMSGNKTTKHDNHRQ
jgi:hypothetical protein